MTTNTSVPAFFRRALSIPVALLLAGCVTYSPSQLSAMSAVDLCELQAMQGPNLSQDTKSSLQSELQKRNDNCRNHAAAVAERYQAWMEHVTAGSRINNP